MNVEIYDFLSFYFSKTSISTMNVEIYVFDT